MNDTAKYGKPNFRVSMASLSFAQKVDQVIELQKRLTPIYAQRGILVVPWKSDDEGVIISERGDDQSKFMSKLKSLVPEDMHKEEGAVGKDCFLL